MIDDFRMQNYFLSNFYPHIIFAGPHHITYPTLEHAYQAAKTDSLVEATSISKAASPGFAKRLGRQVKLIDNWDAVKDAVMLRLLIIKFADPVLNSLLEATANEELVEGNYWHDNYWGHCFCAKCKLPGENKLGKMLMQIRNKEFLAA
jgi:hypothetical protein